MNAVKVNVDELRALQKALREQSSARVRVGILGNKAERTDEEWNKEKINNPTLGAVHEFGSKKHNIPARSFLRVPLMLHLPAQVDKIGRAVWRDLILRKSLLEALRALGVLAEAVVQEGFATGGWGQWAPLSPRYARRKENLFRSRKPGGRKFIGPIQMALLILSAQLRKAVTSRVEKGRAKG